MKVLVFFRLLHESVCEVRLQRFPSLPTVVILTSPKDIHKEVCVYASTRQPRYLKTCDSDSNNCLSPVHCGLNSFFCLCCFQSIDV